MLFSSIIFLYYFLPLLLIVYYISKKEYRNTVLLIFSLFFYFYGESKLTIILILISLINFLSAKSMLKHERFKKSILVFTVIVNLLNLGYFKYSNFFIDNLNTIFNLDIKFINVIMPIGISFYTFQALGYVIDVYRNDVEASNNYFDFLMYISLFPQLIAGPIVRYKDVENEIRNREESYSKFSEGIKRFSIGLAKKVVIANNIGELAKIVNDLSDKTIISEWLKTISFTLQIYFDFSGYSDMAIGLGLFFGFRFLENFNYPFISKSITEFYRRWHISLSTFFRDYVYIPLGGSRVSKAKHYRNILIVWALTGFWHGAAYNFIIWGLYFGILLIIEKEFLLKILDKSKILGHMYTIFIILIGFLIFNSTSLNDVIINLRNIFGLNNLALISSETIYYLRSYFILIVVSIVASTPVAKNIISKLKYKAIFGYVESFYYPLLIIICSAYLIDSSFNPFLYFRF